MSQNSNGQLKILNTYAIHLDILKSWSSISNACHLFSGVARGSYIQDGKPLHTMVDPQSLKDSFFRGDGMWLLYTVVHPLRHPYIRRSDNSSTFDSASTIRTKRIALLQNRQHLHTPLQCFAVMRTPLSKS